MAFTRQNCDDDHGIQTFAQSSSHQNSAELSAFQHAQHLAHETSAQQPLDAYDQWSNQALQAFQNQDLATSFPSQQQHQRSSTADTIYAGDGIHSEIHQIHASGWDINSRRPIKTALTSQNDLVHSQTYTGSSDLLLAHLSSTRTSNSTHPFHHHHCLPRQHALSTSDWTGHDTSLHGLEENPPSSVVGDPDMPKPASRPAGPKLRFIPEEDALLIELKETKDLTWKQIADFFPGRSSGTLQVRYCTKLKSKEISWTEPLVSHCPLNSDGDKEADSHCHYIGGAPPSGS